MSRRYLGMDRLVAATLMAVHSIRCATGGCRHCPAEGHEVRITPPPDSCWHRYPIAAGPYLGHHWLSSGGIMEVSKARRVAFRLLATLPLLLFLVVVGPLLLSLVLMWLPDETVLSIFDDMTRADLAHRIHTTGLSMMVWSLVIGVAVQLHRPQSKAAPMLQALTVPVLIIAGDMLTGSFDPFGVIVLALLLVLAFLHPRRGDLLKAPRFDGAMAGLTALAVLPWVIFAFGQARLQRLDLPGDVHAETGHWALMAQLGILIVLWALIGSSDHTGWRLTAWVAGLASLSYGLQSLFYSDVASAASPGWALAAAAWGAFYLVFAERRARADARGRPSVQSRILAA